MPDETTAGGARAWAAYLAYRSLGTAMQRLPESVAAPPAALVAQVMASFGGEARAMYERHLRRVLART